MPRMTKELKNPLSSKTTGESTKVKRPASHLDKVKNPLKK